MKTRGTSVTLRPGESVDRMLKRFARAVEREGILREYTAHVRFLPARTRKYKRRLRAQRQRERANRGKR